MPPFSQENALKTNWSIANSSLTGQRQRMKWFWKLKCKIKQLIHFFYSGKGTKEKPKIETKHLKAFNFSKGNLCENRNNMRKKKQCLWILKTPGPTNERH